MDEVPAFLSDVPLGGARMRFFRGVDWRRSKPHLVLLSKFLRPHTIERYSRSDDWTAVLGESPEKAIRRFVGDGVLTEMEVSAQIDRKLTAAEIKGLLEQRHLPTSGRKLELAQRLVQADPRGMKQTAGPALLQCTETGHEIAERYLADQKAEREEVEKDVLAFLRQRKLREASLAVASFESKQVFQRGLNMDWKHYDPTHDISVLTHILGGKPKALPQLDDLRLGPVRIAAAMFHLYGPNQGKGWLPAGVSLGLRWDDDRVVDMLFTYGVFRANIEQYKQMGVRWVKVLGCNDDLVCGACAKLQSRRHGITEVPELPYEKCTSDTGCRCTVVSAPE